jgi:hypothetical protein
MTYDITSDMGPITCSAGQMNTLRLVLLEMPPVAGYADVRA